MPRNEEAEVDCVNFSRCIHHNDLSGDITIKLTIGDQFVYEEISDLRPELQYLNGLSCRLWGAVDLRDKQTWQLYSNNCD